LTHDLENLITSSPVRSLVKIVFELLAVGYKQTNKQATS